MTISEIGSAVRMALATVREHKMRSLLTVLGVIIGTGTVIAVGSIITGVDETIVGMVNGYGPNTAYAFKFNIGFSGNRTGEELRRKPLTWENARAVAERCPSVEHVAPFLFPPSVFRGGQAGNRAKYKGNDVYRIQFNGTEEGYMASGNGAMLQGRFFTDMENYRRAPVIVLGEDLAKGLFQGVEAVGKSIDINGHTFDVVGVMARPAASFPGQEDLRALVPFFTMSKMFPARQGTDAGDHCAPRPHGLRAR